MGEGKLKQTRGKWVRGAPGKTGMLLHALHPSLSQWGGLSSLFTKSYLPQALYRLLHSAKTVENKTLPVNHRPLLHMGHEEEAENQAGQTMGRSPM